ncbi:MAG: alkaline phosphatase family protein [Candidatus Hydrogenedentes bacterium]|nr:alkaline phosphatase family protein [Candidatus Hydrogenedentota bacterium]
MRVRISALALLLIASCATSPNPRGIDEALGIGPDEFLVMAAVGPQDDGTYVVPTTQRIEPAGEQILFPGRPVDLALSPDGALLAVKGKNDVIFINRETKQIAQTLKLPSGGNSFCGLAWSRDGNILWNTSPDQFLRGAVRKPDNSFAWEIEILLPGPGDKNSSPGGLTLGENGLAYVTLSRNNSVGVINLETKSVEIEIPVGIAPYTVLAHGAKLYVTNWGGRRPREGEVTGPTAGSRVLVDPQTGIASSGTVSVIDRATRAVTAEIEVQLHPSEMALSPDGSRLYVANANSDTVSVIDTTSDTVIDTLGVKPMAELPFGCAPNALTVSADGNTLYVCNGGNNAIAVVDVNTKRVTGLIPTGWYPGAILLNENTLYVANTKGVGSRNEKANPEEKKSRFGENWSGFNSHDHLGSLSIVNVPTPAELEPYTTRVASNMRLPRIHEQLTLTKGESRTVPVPERPGDVSPIKHVLYIIKENRTYDQVFGDMQQGNGDPRLVLFGRDVTPNHHALAEQFVLLDNFYCNGVLSADGHQWSNEGFVTDYLEKSFGDFSRSYPYDGDDALAYASSGFIWDYVLRAGLSFRCYGEFVKAKIEPSSATWTDIYNDYKNGTRNVSIRATTELHTLEPYLCPEFIGFPGKVQDVYRAQHFIRELKEFEKNGNLPNFMIMLLPNDHTSGTREGMPTPRAAVADNDLALGQIVEAVSHSKYWPETAIFVVEDDPQAGLDHVDGHRTVALCISPYVKRKTVDSTHYNQSSMLRTMELILGLPPMNQLDLAANPMDNCFMNEPDPAPYIAVPNNIPLDEMNPKLATLSGKQLHYAKLSHEQPLDDIDMADETTFNLILWHAVKGYDTPYPKLAQRRQVGAEHWPGMNAQKDGDD